MNAQYFRTTSNITAASGPMKRRLENAEDIFSAPQSVLVATVQQSQASLAGSPHPNRGTTSTPAIQTSAPLFECLFSPIKDSSKY